jgi:hypothetical protein
MDTITAFQNVMAVKLENDLAVSVLYLSAQEYNRSYAEHVLFDNDLRENIDKDITAKVTNSFYSETRNCGIIPSRPKQIESIRLTIILKAYYSRLLPALSDSVLKHQTLKGTQAIDKNRC